MTSPSQTSATQHCADCGGPLVGGACAACAFQWLRGGAMPGEGSSPEAMESKGLSARVGRYILQRCIARGGMGIVYAAEDTELHRTVALKVLRGAMFAGPGEVARFTLETKAAAALDHPHIVPVYEVGQEDGEPFFTMKLIDGRTLADRLRVDGPMPAREAAALLAPVARAVEHAHAQGVLHRDLKPGNIMLDAAGRPWLTDFGLAKFSAADSGLTRSTDTLGTPLYMSPEMAAGRAHEFTAASDVWALGVILWEMTGGAPPFNGQSPVEILQAVVKDDLPAPPDALRQHRDLLTIARRCMEKRPADRMASAGVIADELERFLRGEPIHARPVAPLEMFVKWMRRRPLHAALLALGAVFLTVSSLLWLRAEKSNSALTTSYSDLAGANARLDESLRISTATRLAGEARLAVAENPDRALLLAAHAAEMHTSGRPVPEAVSALFEVMQQAGGTDCTPAPADVDHPDDKLHSRERLRNAAEISPDGRWLLAISSREYYLNGRELTAALYDLHATHRAAPVRRWQLENSGTRAGFGPRSLWLADSRRLLLLDGRATVHLVTPLDGLAATPEDTVPAFSTPPSQKLGTFTPPERTPMPAVSTDQPDGADSTVSAEEMNLEMIEMRRLPDNSAAFALCWRSGEMCTLQRWTAGQAGLTLQASAPEPQAMPPRLIFDLSPAGRWLVIGGTGAEILTKEGAIALLYDFDRMDQPPRRLMTDPDAAAQWTEISRTMMATQEPEPAFGTAREPEDFLILPHPGHMLWVHSLRGTAPGGEVPGDPILTNASALMAFALSPDSRRLVECRQDGLVEVYPLTLSDTEPMGIAAGEPVHLPGTSGGHCVTFSPDGRWLLTSQVQEVHFWDLAAGLVPGLQPQRLAGSAVRIGHLSISADSRTLLAVGAGSVMRRWTFDGATKGLNPRAIAAGGENVREVALSPDGEWLAAACEGAAALHVEDPRSDGWVAAARLDGSRAVQIASHGNMATSVAFSRDGKWLAAAGGTKVRAWNFTETAAAIDAGRAPPQRVLSYQHDSILPHYDARLAWFPGDQLYCVHGGGGDLHWDMTATDPAATTLGAAVSSILYQLPALTLSPDGRFKAIARHGWDHGKPKPGTPQQGNQVLLYDGTFEDHSILRHALPANFRDRTTLAISPDGRWLAAGGQGAPATLWDLNAADIAASRREAPVSADLSAGVAFSPDSRRLAIGTGSSGAGTLNFWDFQRAAAGPDASISKAGEALKSVITIRTPRAIQTIVWHPDGRLLTGGGGPSVSVWETDMTKLIRMARSAAGRGLTPVERARHAL